MATVGDVKALLNRATEGIGVATVTTGAALAQATEARAAVLAARGDTNADLGEEMLALAEGKYGEALALLHLATETIRGYEASL
jgi:hypothetical protein